MKKGLVSVLLILLVKLAYAHTWEMGLRVVDTQGNPESKVVRLYLENEPSTPYREASSADYWIMDGANFISDVGDNNTSNASWVSINPGTYYLRIDNSYVYIEIPEPPPGEGDFLIKYQFGLFSIVWDHRGITMSGTGTWTFYTVTVRNSFDGGEVWVDGSLRSSGSQFSWLSMTEHTLTAIDRQIFPEGGADYVRVFQGWQGPQSGTGLTLQAQATGDGTYTANFAKEFNIWFENSFVGVGNKGVIKVNGTEYQLPLSQPFHVLQTNPIITAEALPQAVNGIYYSFTQWEDGSTENPRTFTPTDHATYRAHYAGKPVAVTMKSLGGPVGEPVQIVWYNHVNPNVTQYQVWRKVKHNGVVGDPVLLATVNRPDSSYTDYDYLNTGSYTDDLLYYDARAYYSIEGSYADPHYTATFGEEALPKIVGGGAELFIADVGEKPYSVSVSPNPFNSMAVIRFFLRERGHVVLSVMDILGREVIRLIDEEKESGEHAVFFDGSRFASGIYFYRLQAGSLSAVKKMVLVK